MDKYKSSQNDESGAQSGDSPKASIHKKACELLKCLFDYNV